MAQLIPITHGFTAFRASFSGAGLDVVAGDIALELVIGLCYAVIGLFLFVKMEAAARYRGDLERID